MTPEQLQAIRERLEAGVFSGIALSTVDQLITEIERLKAERDEQRKDSTERYLSMDREIMDLKLQNQRLHGVLEQIAKGSRAIDNWQTAVARKALEGSK